MSKMKKMLSWFVTVDGDEGAEVPRDAADTDPEVAAAAAAEYVEANDLPHEDSGRTPRRVSELDFDPDAGHISDEDVAMLADVRVGGLASFNEIYLAAGLATAEDAGFHIFTVERLLQSSHIAGLSERAKAAAVMVSMEASRVKLSDVIGDAMMRDNVLDQMEESLKSQLEELTLEVEDSNATIQQEIEDFLALKREEMSMNNERLDGARVAFEEWSSAKAAEEQRLFDAVSPLLKPGELNPITRD